MYRVNLERVEKDLKKIPPHIYHKLLEWVEDVEKYGLIKVREKPGYHDEPLQGKRFGQRSVRLSKSYRIIYKLTKDGIIHLLIVLEVNKHDY